MARGRAIGSTNRSNRPLAPGKMRGPSQRIAYPISRLVSLRQNGVGTGFTSADAILPKGHELFDAVISTILVYSVPFTGPRTLFHIDEIPNLQPFRLRVIGFDRDLWVAVTEK